MARMRTFFLYFLGIVGFIFLSYILENGLIEGMYKQMNAEKSSVTSSESVCIEDVEGKASNVNGYMQFKLKNKSNQTSTEYVKIDLYSKRGAEVATKYVPITDLDSGDTKSYQVKFKGNSIDSYKISIVDEIPDKSNILNILGWEFDLTNILGMDLSDFTIFGVRLADLFTWDNLKTAGGNAYSWAMNFLNVIPWWGYAIGTMITLWNMPARFLFGLFPI